MVVLMMSTAGLFQIFLFTSSLYFSESTVISLSFCIDKSDGNPCLITCQTSDVNQDVSISKSPNYHIALGTCVVGGTCFSADNSLYNVTQIGTNTNLEILSFSKSYNATWRCEYTGQTALDKFLSWSKLPTSITELSGLTSNETITDELTISIEVGCLYSIQAPTTKLQLMCNGALVTAYDMSCNPSTTVCSDPDLSAYICNYTITANPPAQPCNSGTSGYSLKALVNLDGTTRTYGSDIFESYRVSFESKTSTTTTTPTIPTIPTTPTSTETPQDKCFGISVPFSKDICKLIYGCIGVFLVLPFILCVVIYCKKNQCKEKKYADGSQSLEKTSIAVPLKKLQKKSDSDQGIKDGQMSACELKKGDSKRENITLTKQEQNGLQNNKNLQMTDAQALKSTGQRPPNDNYQCNWERI